MKRILKVYIPKPDGGYRYSEHVEDDTTGGIMIEIQGPRSAIVRYVEGDAIVETRYLGFPMIYRTESRQPQERVRCEDEASLADSPVS